MVTGTGVLTSNSTYDVQSGIVESVLAGTSGLTKSQNGVVVLKGDNTYAGTTTIDGGILALSAGGQIDALSTIDNRATFLVADGTHTVGDIAGSGSIMVGNNARLTAHSIVQDTLTIGGDYSSLLTPAKAAVPEPGSLAILASLGVVLAAAWLRKKI